jgi:hypothetical protein
MTKCWSNTQLERSRICEVPFEQAYFFHITVLLMPSRPIRYPLLSML